MKDAGHLFRLAVAFAVVFGGFIALRAAFVPKNFGVYGHYRADTMSEVAALPVVHAGQDACATCHTDQFEFKSKGKHKGVSCEACHSAQGKHANDPSSVVPAKPDPAVLCAQCHEASAPKPKWFPQVVTSEHYGGMVCNTCHKPHNPSLKEEVKK